MIAFAILFALQGRRFKFTVPVVNSWTGPTRAGNGRQIDVKAKIEQANRQKGRALKLFIKVKLESVEGGVEIFGQEAGRIAI